MQLRRSTRIPVPKSYKDYYLYSTQSNFSDPVTVKEALNSPDAIKWKEAMNKELESINKNNTWNLVKLPSNRKAIQTKWVFKSKDFDGNVVQSTSSCQRFPQKGGIDYTETYAPVRHASLRLFLP